MSSPPTLWTTFLISIGGSGVLIAIVSFIGKIWVETRIKEEVQFEYKKRLESFKNDLIKESVKDESYNESDRKLFNELVNELPGDADCFDLITGPAFGQRIERERLKKLWDFETNWCDAHHEFHNNDIEDMKKNLLEGINELYDFYAINTCVDDRYSEYNCVPIELRQNDHKKYYEIINSLDDLGKMVKQIYEDLIRCGRKTLGL